MTNVATSLEPGAKAAIVDGLTQVVAEVALETMKAQNYHWNVKGMGFGPLHALFQTIYEDHFVAQDDLSERVRALDAHAEGRMSVFLKRSKVGECDGKLDAETMIANLVKDQETISGALIALSKLAAEHGDLVTEDIAIGRAAVHDKFAWLLRAHLRG